MAFTDRQYDEIAQSLKDTAGALGKIAQKLNVGDAMGSTDPRKATKAQRKAQVEKLEKDLNKQLGRYSDFNRKAADNAEKTGEKFKSLSGDMEAFSKGLNKFLRILPGGAALGALIGYGKGLVDNWRAMSEVGQTFNGSVFKMAAAAGEAGLPLGQFAEIVKKNSKIMASFGQKDVMQAMKGVRNLAAESGMYGMTIQQLADVTGDYLEIQRLMGNRQAALNKSTVKSANEFAATLSSLAQATGKSREEIEKITLEAMSDVAITTKNFGQNSRAQQAFTDNTMKAVATMGSINGQAGEILSKMLTQAAGYGTSLFSEGAQTFIEAGMGQMVSAMDKVGSAMNGSAAEATAATGDFLKQLKHDTADNLSALQLQAMAGNQSAKQVLEMYSQIRNMTDEQIDAMSKQKVVADKFTKFMTTIGTKLQEMFGNVWSRLMKHFGNIDDHMSDLMNSPVWKTLEDTFFTLGKNLGDWLENLKPEEIQSWVHAFEDGFGIFVDVLNAAGTILKSIVGALAKFAHAIDFVEEKLGGKGNGSLVAAVVTGIGVLFGPQLFKSLIMPKLLQFFRIGSGMNLKDAFIKADNVNVMGGGGGGGDFGGLGGGGKAEGAAVKEGEALAKGGKKLGIMGRMGSRLGKIWRHPAGRAGLIGAGIGTAALLGSMLFGHKDKTDSDGVPAMTSSGGGGSFLGGAAGVGMLGMGLMPKTMGKLGTGIGGKLGGKIAGAAGAKAMGRIGGAFIPGVGAAMDSYSSYDAFRHGHRLAGGLYGVGAALNGLGAGLDATGVGALAGVPLDLLGGLATMGGVAAESTGFGDNWFGGKKSGSVSKAASRVAQQSAELGKSLQDNAPTPQTDQNMAMIAEYQKSIKGHMEQQTGLMAQNNELMKKLVKSNKTIADNT